MKNIPTCGSIDLQECLEIEGVIYWFVLFLPFLWALGILHPMGAILLLWILVKRNFFDLVLHPVVLGWLLVGLAQGVSVFINWWEMDRGIFHLLYRLISTPVSGWFFIGAGIAAGRGLDFRSEKLQKAFSLLGIYILTLGVFSLVLFFIFNVDSIFFVTPFGSIFPDGMPVVRFLLTLKLYQAEEIFGYQFPRMVFFYSWFVALGFTSLSLIFINMGEKNIKWKFFGIAGGLMGLLGSHSRAGVMIFLLTSILYVCLKWNRSLQWFVLSLISISAVILVNFKSMIVESISFFYEGLMDLRRGSSEARETINEASWEGFLNSPLWGHGWPGEAVSSNIEAAVGGHSTIFGLLYTGGIISFIPFCIASLLTFLVIFSKALDGGHVEKTSLVIVTSLLLLSYGEGIYSFALPGLLIFFWIGGSLKTQEHNLVLP